MTCRYCDAAVSASPVKWLAYQGEPIPVVTWDCAACGRFGLTGVALEVRRAQRGVGPSLVAIDCRPGVDDGGALAPTSDQDCRTPAAALPAENHDA